MFNSFIFDPYVTNESKPVQVESSHSELESLFIYERCTPITFGDYIFTPIITGKLKIHFLYAATLQIERIQSNIFHVAG